MSISPRAGDRLRPELELILYCVRSRFDRASIARLETLLQGPMDWSNVVDTAFEHHVETPVFESLQQFGNAPVPTASMELLRSNVRRAAGLAILYFSELIQIQESFDAASVPLIPYKGPVLGWLAYRSLTSRRFVDLDFFVPHEQIPNASALLVASGFDAAEEQQGDTPGRTSAVPGQYAFSRQATRAQVELHSERTLRYFPVPLDFEKMKQRLITVEVAGKTLHTFSIEDTIIMLCVHGAKHFWERIGWVLDVAQLVRTQSVDWQKTMRIAAKLKSIRLLLLGLYLADELSGGSEPAVVPAKIMERARRDPSVLWLAGKVRARLAAETGARMGVLPRFVFRYRSRDRMTDAVRHVLRLTMSPTATDQQGVRLPAVLAPMYALVRPWKLIREYGIGLNRVRQIDRGSQSPRGNRSFHLKDVGEEDPRE